MSCLMRQVLMRPATALASPGQTTGRQILFFNLSKLSDHHNNSAISSTGTLFSMNTSLSNNRHTSSAMNMHTSAALNLHISTALERARQMTRIRKRKIDVANKKAKEERLRKNPPPLPYKVQLMMRAKGINSTPIPWRETSDKPFPVDDAWSENYHTWTRLSVAEGLECLREHYHPSMLNDPNAIVWARVEIDMKGSKQGRYMEPFNKMVPLYHAFERGVAEKNILVFAKTPESREEAQNAGANMTGGLELIDSIAKGKFEVIDFDHFLAHEDIVHDLKPLIGILRDNFPKKTNGMVGKDMEKLVKTFQNGQLVEVKKPKSTLGRIDDPSFGYAEAMVGRLGMEDEHVGVNLDLLLEGLLENAPGKRAGQFITRVEFFVEGLLKRKFTIHHRLVYDKAFTDHLESLKTKN